VKGRIALIAAMLIFSTGSTFGEVVDSAPGGFDLKLVIDIHAATEDVYAKLVHNVGDWWSSQHTFSQDSHNLSIDDKPMGCFCEKLPNGVASGIWRW
jgi:hypothetical protein